ncbi:DUF402 domain-containing protein [Streptomyces rectiverticillatus]|uniref:DUF402 domain-containing protein n=1 Tax=Streptomyces rectiverticillatus TaxID=173860 RepID=UPI0015C349CC|nr:DUF402 domain-containing protein [Streptomyces rectiverticillatus]QLE71412.1 DUF402 domain-containing protein [Streptomyces rectiverticillatus]
MSTESPLHPPHLTTLTAGSDVTVTLVKESRSGIGYPAVVVRDDGTHAVVRAPWAAPSDRDFGFVRFERGDVFTEHYWRDRWYAVKEVRTADGTLKGWYCDITRPAQITGDGVVSTDLDLDLWVSADGTTVLRLDEDEFEESGLERHDPAAAGRARAALDELERLARAGGLTGLLG